jgi:hypothetical protein
MGGLIENRKEENAYVIFYLHFTDFRIQGKRGTASGSATKNLSFFTQIIVAKLVEI